MRRATYGTTCIGSKAFIRCPRSFPFLGPAPLMIRCKAELSRSGSHLASQSQRSRELSRCPFGRFAPGPAVVSVWRVGSRSTYSNSTLKIASLFFLDLGSLNLTVIRLSRGLRCYVTVFGSPTSRVGIWPESCPFGAWPILRLADGRGLAGCHPPPRIAIIAGMEANT